ncbi:protein-tyrosine phosphatase [Chryseobacterium sp. SORGH_AS 447]|uniref:tyrosine-protein phosphatase n=1 Tax=Chryseobacterium sp. SORGH_AS_0447 TaxID=3041769 RepID=UPI002788E8DF|nr:tyrosine-protein phosphatase [Chryseobacterium sp. SORGH_AS_0447]MDQ1161061.1 protein-tyrosine phosphatase [Chryseobacterium sp. SORGH_AS_0447]
MKSILKIPFLLLVFISVFSCRTQQISEPEYGQNTAEANLFKLKKKSFKRIENLGIQEIIDLRNSKEIAKKPDRLPEGIAYKNYSAFEDEGDQLDQAKKLVLKGKVNGADAEKRMLDFYRNYVTEHPEVIRKIITEILDSDTPVLYHCTAGKDRTGIITALILTILRFDKETIYNDYLLSNNYREKLVKRRLSLSRDLHFIYPKLDIGVLEKLSWVQTSYLDAAFNEINKKYGSTDRYIQEVLGISENKREEYIQKFTY